MEILVDYDNLERPQTHGGLLTLCTQIFEVVRPRRQKAPDRCRVRFYGGWYDEHGLSRKAENIIAELDTISQISVIWNIQGEKVVPRRL